MEPTRATSTGRLMLTMLATLAEYEHELIVERVRAGAAVAPETGTKLGRPNNPAVVGQNLVIVAKARAEGRTATGAAALVDGVERRCTGTGKHARLPTRRRWSPRPPVHTCRARGVPGFETTRPAP